MPISVICPSCGTKLNAPDQHAGKRGKCPKCQATVELAPAPSAPLNTDMAEGFRVADLPTPRGLPVEAVPASVPGPVPEAGERRKRRKKKPKGFLGRLALPAVSIEPGLIKIALGMAAVLSLGFAGYYGLRSAFRVPPPPVIAAEKWQPLEIAGRFKVLLPGAAQPLTQTAAGMQMTFYNYQPDKDSVYSVAYMHEVLPPHRRGLPVETLLNDACDGAIANTKSQGSVEVSRRSIQLGS